MKHEELIKATKDQLNARLKEIGAAAKTAEGDALDTLLTEAQDIRDILDQAKKREQLQGFADSAEDPQPGAGESFPPVSRRRASGLPCLSHRPRPWFIPRRI